MATSKKLWEILGANRLREPGRCSLALPRPCQKVLQPRQFLRLSDTDAFNAFCYRINPNMCHYDLLWYSTAAIQKLREKFYNSYSVFAHLPWDGKRESLIEEKYECIYTFLVQIHCKYRSTFQCIFFCIFLSCWWVWFMWQKTARSWLSDKNNESNLTVPEIQGFHHVLLHEVEARQPSIVLFTPPTSLPRVVCAMNQIHWG